MTTITNVGIVDLKKIKEGDQVDGFFLVRSSESGVASNQKAFLTLLLGTKTGEIEAKIWSSTEEQKEFCSNGNLIKVRATVKEYNGKLQFTIMKVRPVIEEDGVTVEDLVETAPIDKKEVEKEIVETILSFKDVELRELTLKLFGKYRDEFLVHVAAKKNHHNMVSGLAWHTISMLHLAKRIAPLYPKVNEELVYASVILHDIGKVREIEDILSPKFSVEGALLGHISIMVSEVQQAANELIQEGVIKPDSLIPTILASNIASHHGKLEYGSPVEPKTIEAELLHHIDMIDSRMNMISAALDGGTKGEFVKVPAMRRDFLVH